MKKKRLLMMICTVSIFRIFVFSHTLTEGILSDTNYVNNATINRGIIFWKNKLESTFKVKATLDIYNDKSPNAYARRMALGENGAIGLGEKMLQQIVLKSYFRNKGLGAVLAHEYAHVLQFNKGCTLKGKYLELHADFLVGYFFGQLTSKRNEILQVANILFDFGDYDKISYGHHGTPEERMAQVLRGFEQRDLKLKEAYVNGMNF